MAGVFKLHLCVLHAQLALLRQRPTLGVSSQVQRQALAVLVLGLDAHIPVLGIQRAQLLFEALLVDTGWQQQLVCLEGGLQRVQNLAAIELVQGLEGHELVGRGALPLALSINATGRDQAMQVGVAGEVAAPGVQRHHQAGSCAQVLGVGKQFEQTAPGAVKEHANEPAPVVLPKRKQAMGQSEDDVKVRARQKALELSVDPRLTRVSAALGAGTVAASVVLNLRVIAVIADLPMQT